MIGINDEKIYFYFHSILQLIEPIYNNLANNAKNMNINYYIRPVVNFVQKVTIAG